ncbi:MAG: AAA family ATPase [Nitrospirae bacterium]|nr:AAA family ATPase [Nitrospirota bacterium]
MGIKIDKISVKNLGPIQEFNKELSLLNLIYSPNEKGKTFLTEFIICALFKNKDRWKCVREGGSGKVWISGLVNSPVEFSPSTRNKLEDYWEKDGRGLLPSMVKLIVSKGAESLIEDTNDGISKNFMKEILSGISLLDKIDNDNISKTVKSAQLEDGRIIMDRRGGKDYYSLKEELVEIDKLFAEIETKYLKGIIETYKIQEKSLQEQLEKLTKAKFHEAYLIAEKVKELETELSKISEDGLKQIETALSLYISKMGSHEKLGKDYKDAVERSKNFSWLQKALSNYKDLTTEIIEKPSNLLLFVGGILAVITVILIFSEQKFASIVSFLGTLAVAVMYIKKLYDASKHTGQNGELNKIKVEFTNRTGKELTDIALIETELEMQRKFYDKAETLDEQLKNLDRELSNDYFSIQQKFINLAGQEIEKSNWNSTLSGIKQKINNLKNEIKERQLKLNKLRVDETDYLHEDVGVKYSQEEIEKVERKLNEIKNKIGIKEKDFEDLKPKVCSKTGDDLSIGWEQLLENLRNKRLEKQNQLNELEAKIIAGIIVHRVISQLRNEEDIKIREGLESDMVLKPLKDLTQRYNKLALDGDNLTVSDDYSNFSLKDLSTGAKEQVMLALRIGFSSKLLKQDSLFLILDDAFQHTDWERRKTVVEQLADITKKGWQIIYLTMDNHIKGLFDEVGKELREDYKSLEL